MNQAWFIVQLRQIGNIGANEVVVVKEQPDEGFKDKEAAVTYMQAKAKAKAYPYERHWKRFSVMEIFSPVKD